jgi:hypothetical protein
MSKFLLQRLQGITKVFSCCFGFPTQLKGKEEDFESRPAEPAKTNDRTSNASPIQHDQQQTSACRQVEKVPQEYTFDVPHINLEPDNQHTPPPTIKQNRPTSAVSSRTRSKSEVSHHPSRTVKYSRSKKSKSPVKLFQRRATQRWCRLLSCEKSRIAETGLRKALGPHWPTFVQYALTHYRPQWFEVFGQMMNCAGPLQGEGCPSNMEVNPNCLTDLDKMCLLHMDHAYPLHIICHTWMQIINSQPNPLTSWDQGIDKDLVCHLLFGVEDHPMGQTDGRSIWKANVKFRCCLGKTGCHDLIGYSHTNFRLESSDLIADQ